MGGWLGGKPTDWACCAISGMRYARFSRTMRPRSPRPRGSGPIRRRCSAAIPLVTNCSITPWSSTMPSAAYSALINARTRLTMSCRTRPSAVHAGDPAGCGVQRFEPFRRLRSSSRDHAVLLDGQFDGVDDRVEMRVRRRLQRHPADRLRSSGHAQVEPSRRRGAHPDRRARRSRAPPVAHPISGTSSQMPCALVAIASASSAAVSRCVRSGSGSRCDAIKASSRPMTGMTSPSPAA